MSLLNKSARISRDQKLIEGIKKHLVGASLVVANQTYTADEAVAALQARVDSDNAVIAARAEWQNLVQAASLKQEQTKLFANGLRQVIGLMFSQAVDTLSDFGLVPRKVRVALPTEKKVVTVKKAQATRVARHTMSKKQKSQIKGTVPETAPATKTPPA